MMDSTCDDQHVQDWNDQHVQDWNDQHVQDWNDQHVQDWNDQHVQEWYNEVPVYISDDLQQAIKAHPGFSAPPIGPIRDSITSEQLRYHIPGSLASSYIVNSQKDVPILRKLIDSYKESQPTVITHPYAKSMYNIECRNADVAIKEALKMENPTTANVLIDHLGLLSSEGI